MQVTRVLSICSYIVFLGQRGHIYLSAYFSNNIQNIVYYTIILVLLMLLTNLYTELNAVDNRIASPNLGPELLH